MLYYCVGCELQMCALCRSMCMNVQGLCNVDSGYLCNCATAYLQWKACHFYCEFRLVFIYCTSRHFAAASALQSRCFYSQFAAFIAFDTSELC